MVPIHAVLYQELPVGAHTICLHSAHDFHPYGGLITDEIKIFFGSCKVIDQSLDRRIETDKDKTTIGFDPRRHGEAESLTVKGPAVSLIAWHTNKVSLIIKRPGMVEALECFGIAGLLTAHQGTTMCAGVEKDTYHTISAAYKNDWSASHASSPKVTWLRDFRGMPSIDPAAFKHATLFDIKYARIGKHTAIDAKYTIHSIIYDQMVSSNIFHAYAPFP
jgi:hypothetical protein